MTDIDLNSTKPHNFGETIYMDLTDIKCVQVTITMGFRGGVLKAQLLDQQHQHGWKTC